MTLCFRLRRHPPLFVDIGFFCIDQRDVVALMWLCVCTQSPYEWLFVPLMCRCVGVCVVLISARVPGRCFPLPRQLFGFTLAECTILLLPLDVVRRGGHLDTQCAQGVAVLVCGCQA